MAYECDGTGVRVFKNGQLIAAYQYATGTVAPTYNAGDTEILFGLRHLFPNQSFPANPWVDALIEEAHIYTGCLDEEDL